MRATHSKHSTQCHPELYSFFVFLGNSQAPRLNLVESCCQIDSFHKNFCFGLFFISIFCVSHFESCSISCRKKSISFRLYLSDFVSLFVDGADMIQWLELNQENIHSADSKMLSLLRTYPHFMTLYVIVTFFQNEILEKKN